MITASRRASLSMLAHRTRILSSLHAHQLASPSAPDGPPSLHVQRAEDDVTSGRAARCSASACEAATWTCSSTTARELPVLSGFCTLLLNGAPPPHCPTTAGTACARQLGSSPASLSLCSCMRGCLTRVPRGAPAHQQILSPRPAGTPLPVRLCALLSHDHIHVTASHGALAALRGQRARARLNRASYAFILILGLLHIDIRAASQPILARRA